MVLANSRSIFVESHIQNPMELVFNTPMVSNALSKAFDTPIKTEQIVTSLDSWLLPWQASFCFHEPHSLDPHPELRVVQVFNPIQKPVATNFNAAMSSIDGLVKLVRYVSKPQGHVILDASIEITAFQPSTGSINESLK